MLIQFSPNNHEFSKYLFLKKEENLSFYANFMMDQYKKQTNKVSCNVECDAFIVSDIN